MGRLNRIAGKLVRKRWSPEQIAAMVGSYRDVWLGHAANEAVRECAASGGVVSALLIDLLERGRIDGVLVCSSAIEDGQVRPRFYVATTAEDILAGVERHHGAVRVDVHLFHLAADLAVHRGDVLADQLAGAGRLLAAGEGAEHVGELLGQLDAADLRDLADHVGGLRGLQGVLLLELGHQQAAIGRERGVVDHPLVGPPAPNEPPAGRLPQGQMTVPAAGDQVA